MKEKGIDNSEILKNVAISDEILSKLNDLYIWFSVKLS